MGRRLLAVAAAAALTLTACGSDGGDDDADEGGSQVDEGLVADVVDLGYSDETARCLVERFGNSLPREDFLASLDEGAQDDEDAAPPTTSADGEEAGPPPDFDADARSQAEELSFCVSSSEEGALDSDDDVILDEDEGDADAAGDIEPSDDEPTEGDGG